MRFDAETTVAQQYKLGEVVPQSGIYTITHDLAAQDPQRAVADDGGRGVSDRLWSIEDIVT
jgi:hypothetical protein